MAVLTKMLNLSQETRLGVHTRGIVPTKITDGLHYGAADYGAVNRVLDGLALSPNDVFIDIGCGMGRVLCLAARRRVQRAGGQRHARSAGPDGP